MAKKKGKTKQKKPEPKQKEKAKPRRKKGQRKKFFQATIPLTSAKVHLYGYSPEDIAGSYVKIDLTRILRGKNLELRSKINVSKDGLEGELISLKLLSSYIKKVMRRGTDKIEDSFIITCKDAKLKVKPFMVTRKRVSRVVRNNIRKTARKYIEGKIKIKTTQEIFSEIMSSKLQKEISLKVKKIYPLSLCEIRMIEVLETFDLKKEKAKEPEKKADQ